MGLGLSAPKGEGDSDILHHVLQGHEGGVNCVDISEDGDYLVTGSEDCTAIIWTTHLSNPGCYGQLVGHKGRINCIAFAADNYIITGSADSTIRKWDFKSLECVLKIGYDKTDEYDEDIDYSKVHTNIIQRIIYAGDFIFSSSYDKTARCFDFDTGECLRVFKGHTRGVYPLLFRPADEKLDDYPDDEPDILITGSADSTAISWNLDTGRSIFVFKGHEGQITCLALDEPGDFLFTGSTDQKVIGWSLLNGTAMRYFEGHQGIITCLQVVGKLLYTGSGDCSVRKWFTKAERRPHPLSIYQGAKRSVTALRVLNYMDERFVIASSGDASVRCYEEETATMVSEVEHRGSVTSFLIPQDKKAYEESARKHGTPLEYDMRSTMYTVSYDHDVRVWLVGRYLGYKDYE